MVVLQGDTGPAIIPIRSWLGDNALFSMMSVGPPRERERFVRESKVHESCKLGRLSALAPPETAHGLVSGALGSTPAAQCKENQASLN